MSYLSVDEILNLYVIFDMHFTDTEIINKPSINDNELNVLMKDETIDYIKTSIIFFNKSYTIFKYRYNPKLKIIHSEKYDHMEIIKMECKFEKTDDKYDDIEPLIIYLHLVPDYNYKNVKWIQNMDQKKLNKLTEKAIMKGWHLNYDGLYIDDKLHVFETLKNLIYSINKRPIKNL